MSRPEQDALARLGPGGLARALGDLLDHSRLVRLANTCGLEYPGMRTRSQTPERILSDLVRKAGSDPATRRAVFRALQKETRAEARKWSALSPEDRRQRAEDVEFLRTNGRLGRHLFLAASSDHEDDRERLDALLSIEKALREKSAAAEPARETTRLERRATELARKVRRLETQLAASRETEKTAKKDLIQRKGELAESRMRAERLRHDLDAAEERLKKAEKTPAAVPRPAEDSAKVLQSVRRLATEQRKLVHRIDKLDEALAARAGSRPVSAEALEALEGGVAGIRAEIEALRRERKKDLLRRDRRLDDLGARVDQALARRAGPARPRTSPGPDGRERVGVFIDVQNMYYAARQRKGKLDFDALLQAAVRERRLIQATAYVVESSEIDQSGFIGILQKRAIDVRRKTLQIRADGSMKGDWDMELALDVLDAAPDLDVVVLVSGDGDFTSLVNRVKRMGPRVEVFGFPRNTAKSLVESADHFQPLNRKFMIYPARRNPGGARRDPRPPSPAPRAASDTPDATGR